MNSLLVGSVKSYDGTDFETQKPYFVMWGLTPTLGISRVPGPSHALDGCLSSMVPFNYLQTS